MKITAYERGIKSPNGHFATLDEIDEDERARRRELVRAAVKRMGSPTALGNAIGVGCSQVSAWRNGLKPVPTRLVKSVNSVLEWSDDQVAEMREPGSIIPRWTDDQAQFLAERYHLPRWPAKCIAAELGRSEKAVHDKARAMGLTRPAGPGSNSIRQQLIRLGIPQRTFYNVREELFELGAEHTTEDIIEICQARRIG